MHANLTGAALSGVRARPVEVEVDLKTPVQDPHFSIVGLPDTAVRESRERVQSSISNSAYTFPMGARITVNLAPADVPKEGSLYDLPMALGILVASDLVEAKLLDEFAVIGELSLDGRVRSVNGIISMTIALKEEGFEGVLVPEGNSREAGVVEGIDAIPIKDLSGAVGYFNGTTQIAPRSIHVENIIEDDRSEQGPDFREVRGQDHAKRALTVAAAGGHNALLIGSPGSGKTMLSERIPSILPRLTIDEALETTRVHSISGQLPEGKPLVTERPFEAPHHSISPAGLAGGGTIPSPGAISMAHNGVLFLDELPEFRRSTLEVLRQPLEDEEVTIGRAAGTATFPANVMLVAAMNPCPCGFLTDPRKNCDCQEYAIQRYRSRVSGPLLDRIDIHVDVPAVGYDELAGDSSGTTSRQIRGEVREARACQQDRFSEQTVSTNAGMSNRDVKSTCTPEEKGENMLRNAVERLGLSARAYIKVLKMSRTIADLEGSDQIQEAHLREAVQFRSFDRGTAR